MRILFNHHISGAASFIELMRQGRPEIFVIATHDRSDTPIRLVADRFMPEPPESHTLSPEAYSDWLLDVATAQGVEVVIPYRRRDELARYRGSFARRGIRLLTASDETTMQLLEDKPALLTRMEALGTPITPFRQFQGIEEYERLRMEADLFLDHPGDRCVKPVAGIYGAGFRILRDRLPDTVQLSNLSALTLAEPAFRTMLAAIYRPERMMLMPLLTGPERSVDFACMDGQLLGSVTRLKAPTSQSLYHDPCAEELAGLVARTFRLSGILNLQTIEDAAGTPRLLEVNSRASGGIGMTGLTNVNLPRLLLDAIDGVFPDRPERPEREVIAGRREVFWPVHL